MDNDLKKKLGEDRYKVMREKGTEAPFTGRYVNEKSSGIYECANCGNPLFMSDSKFDSGTGWPSFDRAIEGAIRFERDESHGMSRTEIVCTKCGSHIGHVFDDGPTETGKRFCTNSICLELEKAETDEDSEANKKEA